MAACSQPPAATETQPPATQRPAELEVGPITYEPPVVMVGDMVTVTANVNNLGDIAGTYTAAFSVDGQEVDSKAIQVDPGSSQDVSFQFSKTTAGSYKLSIGNSSTSLTVYNWSPYTIQYDEADGVGMGIYVSGDNGHIVRFSSPNKAFKIQKIQIFEGLYFLNTSDLDKNHFTVRIWDKEGNNQLWSQDFPWRFFWGFYGWKEIKVPDVRVNDDFQVEVVTHSNPMRYKPGTETPSPGGGQIEIAEMGKPVPYEYNNIIIIGFDYPQSCVNSPSNCPETHSGYSYMGKLIDPGQKRLESIRWLIRVEGEGAPAN
jgi:hypothetical protein